LTIDGQHDSRSVGYRSRMPPRSKPALPSTFTGFERGADAFWHELSVEMNKEWFTENKQRYETEWVQPMTQLLTDVAARLAKAYKPIALTAPKVMRIHRDVRFAKDKAPYKTHIGAVIMTGTKLGEGPAALYLHMGLEEEFVGVGSYMFDPARLAKWRKLVAGKDGGALARIVDKLRAAGYQVGGHEDLKRVPKPFDAEHPRAEYLKMKGLTGGFPDIPKGLIHKPGFVDWLVEHGTAMEPLVGWLHDRIG
jgi:uncharacterized protein (TIGR02453 family)